MITSKLGTDELGKRIVIPGGFGPWLMPNSSTGLEFRLDKALVPGKYQLRYEIRRTGEPLVTAQLFTVTDVETAYPSVN